MINLNETMIDYITLGGQQMNNVITIDGVKYKKVEDNTMTVKETATATTVTYKDKTYLRVEQSGYISSVDWWENYGANYMNKVSDVVLTSELNREYTSQHQTLNFGNIFTFNNPYPKDYPYNVGGGGTAVGYDFNTK